MSRMIKVLASNSIRAVMAELVPQFERAHDCTVAISYDAASAIKITIPRPAISGDIDDTDVFGGQQYGPLVDLEVP